MDQRTARRYVRRQLADHATGLARDPGVVGDPDARAVLVAAYEWAATYLSPAGELSVLPANLQPLVRPDGTVPEEWRHLDVRPADPEPDPAEPAPVAGVAG